MNPIIKFNIKSTPAFAPPSNQPKHPRSQPGLARKKTQYNKLIGRQLTQTTPIFHTYQVALGLLNSASQSDKNPAIYADLKFKQTFSPKTSFRHA